MINLNLKPGLRNRKAGPCVKSGQRGSIMVSSIVIGLLVMLVAVGSYNALTRMFTAHNRLEHYQDIQMLRKTIFDYVDCKKTLYPNLNDEKVTAPPPVCSKLPILLVKKDGKPLGQVVQGVQRLGRWNILASCNLKTKSLYVEHLSTDREIAKAFEGYDTNNGIAGALKNPSAQRDIFLGQSNLCQAYFVDNQCPQKTQPQYPVYSGFDRYRNPLCCRQVMVPGQAQAQCNNDEYLAHGGGWCSPADKNFPVPLGEKGFNINGIVGIIKGQSMARTLPKKLLQGATIPAVGVANVAGATGPGMGANEMHTHDIRFTAPAVATAPGIGTYQTIQETMGGFLYESTFVVDSSQTVSAWRVGCRTHDNGDVFGATAWALCCPKKNSGPLP